MLIGALTTAIFVFVAGALWSAGLFLPAGVLGAMAAYRGFFVGRAIWWWITPDDPEESDADDGDDGDDADEGDHVSGS